MMKLYVGNLSFNTQDDQLASLFAEFGEVVSCRVVTDRETGRSRGFAFVEMADAAAGQAAIDGLNDKELDGRMLRINEARPREERPARSGGGYGGGGGGYRGGGGGGGRW